MIPEAPPSYAPEPSQDTETWHSDWGIELRIVDHSQSTAYQTGPQIATDFSGPRSLIVWSAASEDGVPAHKAQDRPFPLSGRDVVIGRSGGCDIFLPNDELVSRRHALLHFTKGTYTILDLGSSNGTQVNGLEIPVETPIHVGDRIQIGSYEIEVSPEQVEPIESDSDMATSDAALSERSNEQDEQDETSVPPQAAEQNAELEAPDEQNPMNDAEGFFTATTTAPKSFSIQGQAAPTQQAEPGADGLDTLQSSLSNIGAILAQRVENAVQDAATLRDGLRQARAMLASALEEQPDPQSVRLPENLPALMTVVDEAAENPSHLDYVTRLAAQSGAVATALHILDNTSAYSSLLDTLQSLFEQLDALSS